MLISKRLCLGCSFALACFLIASAAPKKASSQPAYLPITYDFLDPNSSQIPNIKICYRQGVVLKVSNFNPFLYDLGINGQVVSYNQNFPALLTTALAGSAPDTTATDQKLELANARKSASGAKPALVASLQGQSNYLQAQSDFEKALQAVHTKLPEAERIVIESIGFSDDKSQDQILNDIIQEENKLLIKPPAPPIQTPLDLNNALLPVISEVDVSWRKLSVEFRTLIVDDQNALKGDYDAETTRWQIFDGTDRAKFDLARKNAVSTWDSICKSKFEISGGPFFADGDELIIKITVTRKAGLEARFATKRACSEKPVARLRTKGGIKIDFSVGFAFGRPADRAYYMKARSESDATKVITRNKENESFCAVLPAVFLHVYPRNGRDIALAGTFGIATNKSSVFDYYLGGSLLFGASQRGVLTIGIGIRTISVLGAGLNEKDTLPADITTIPLTNVIHFGYCVGLSFNLGGI